MGVVGLESLSLTSCLSAESGEETPVSPGGRKLDRPRKERVGRRLLGRSQLCTRSIEAGPVGRLSPGHGTGRGLGRPPGEDSGLHPGFRQRDWVMRGGEKGCSRCCSLVAPRVAAVVAAAESTAQAAGAAGRVAQQPFSVICELIKQQKNRAPHYSLLRALPCYSEPIYAEACLALVPG